LGRKSLLCAVTAQCSAHDSNPSIQRRDGQVW
jgi:hypothetical protein